MQQLTQDDFDELLLKIQYTIKECNANIDLFYEVKEHIQRGLDRGARGIVYDYSPYMTEEDCDKIIELNKQAVEDYKELYGKLVILNNAKDLNDSILKIQDFCLSKGITDTINNAIYKHDKLTDEFYTISEKHKEDTTRQQEIENLINKYRGGGR